MTHSMRALLLSCAVIALASCQSPKHPLEPLPEVDSNSGTASPRINSEISPSASSAATAEIDEGQQQTGHAPRLPAAATAGAPVTLDFADTDIREVAKQILGEILHLNYTIDPSVRGTATIETHQPLSRTDLLPTLQSLLAQNGASLIQQGNLFRIVPSAVAAASPSYSAGETTGTQIIPLRYASARQLQKLLEPYVGEGAKLEAEPGRNALVVTGDPGARDAVRSLVTSFDVNMLAGQTYALFPVTEGDPTKVAAELERVFQSQGDGPLGDVLRIVPMDRVNAVLLISPQPRYIAEAKRLFRLIEKGKRETERTWHVYYVQNGQSADLANVLQHAFTPGNVTTTSNGPGSTAPGQGQSLFGSSGFNQSGQSGQGGGGLGQSGSSGGGGALGILQPGGGQPNGFGGAQPNAAGGAQQQSGDGTGGAATDSLSGGASEENGARNTIRIVANKANNALLIYATPSEYGTIEAMLRKVDILPLQVRIDATIAEVTLNDNLQYGTQFTANGGGIQGLLSAAAGATRSTLAGTAAATAGGLTISRLGSAGNAQFVLSALADITNVRVLSSPQILVLDNQPARLEVGSSVPILSQTATSVATSSPEVVNSVEYHETGVILEVIPRVNNGGLVTLDVSQEVSDVATESLGVSSSPTFDERKVQSRIAIQDGQTIGLAGLIRDTTSRENSGIPFLKDIPILGSFVSQQTNTRQRTELLVLITPHVVEDQRKARALTEDMRQKLMDSAEVPDALIKLPPDGESNPNARLTN